MRREEEEGKKDEREKDEMNDGGDSDKRGQQFKVGGRWEGS